MTMRTKTDPRQFTASTLLGPCLSLVLAALGTSTAAVTLPALSRDFQGASLDTTLVVSIYILATTALIVPVGRVGDLIGKRSVLTLGLSLHIIGAILAFYAPTLPILVAGRFVQGAGAAAMMAMPLALVRDFVTPGRVGRWMGLMGTMSAIGTASGPALGGAIIAAFDWRAVYLLQIPVALVALFLCLVCLRSNHRSDTPPDINFAGAGALAVFLAALTFLISDVANGFDLFTIMLFAVVLVAFTGFLAIESRTKNPVIPFELLRSAHLRFSLVMNAMVSLVMMGILVIGPFFLTGGLGLTTVQMGLAMSVGPISAALSGIPAGRFTDRIGPRRAVLVGASALTIATAAMAVLPCVSGLGGFIVAFMLLAPSYQVFLAALNTSVMEYASEQDRGVTSGVLNLSRNFGFILGASAISALFWSLVRLQNGIRDEAQEISLAMAGTFATCCLLALGVVLLAILSNRRQIRADQPDLNALN